MRICQVSYLQTTVSLGQADANPDNPDTPPSSEKKYNFDVDGNGSSNVMDLVILKMHILGKK